MQNSLRSEFSDVDGTVTGSPLDENHSYTTILLSNRENNSSCLKCCPSYRSADTEKRLTPFAVILLLVLLCIYIVNQADRLVLFVAIPSGLRCITSVQEECAETSNKTLNNTDCIHFNDYEQGIITGMLYCI